VKLIGLFKGAVHLFPDFEIKGRGQHNKRAVESGLAPIYNAHSCRECHQNPVSGGSSQITEVRVGNLGRSVAELYRNPLP
jgi:hypothetical protein